MTAWILVADASKARVFELAGVRQPLRLVRELEHPESRAKTSELVTDQRGRLAKGLGRGVRSAMDPRTTPKEAEAEHFAVELARILGIAHARGTFNSLALVAPPHFLGMLRGALAPEVASAVVTTIDQDYTQVEPHDLRDRLEDTIIALLHPRMT